MIIIVAVFILGAVLSCVPFDFTLYSAKEEIGVTNTAYNITANASDGLGEFNDGASYIYTDKTKVDDFRVANIESDLTIQKVKKTQARGSIENPYVIANEDDWDRFAKNLDDGSIANYGSEKYFVLAADLDFKERLFRPVRFFNGIFFGMGHKLQNISVSGTEWQYWNSSTSSYAQIPVSGTGAPLGYGAFCRTTSAVITDLIIENFKYEQMLQTTAYSSRTGTNTGGIIGLSLGDDAVLNCHSIGSILSDIAYSTDVMGAAGIIGGRTYANTQILIYRCSSEVDISLINARRFPASAGILGDGYFGGTIYMYDCAAKVISYLNATDHTSISAAIAVLGGNTVYIEDFVGYADGFTTNNAGSGALMGTYNGTVVGTVKNCYVEGQYGAENGTKYAYYGVAAAVQVTVNNSNVSNINVVKPTNMSYWTSYYTGYGYRLSGHSEPATTAEMITKAQTFFSDKAYSNIWDTDKLDADYNFTPDNSPVRNYLVALISYRNLEGGGNTEKAVPLKTGADGDPFIKGDALYEPTNEYIASKLASNHVFLGWTDDKDGDSEPFYELPSGFYGDVTLFAV
ncbi:MAG: hypothetical protein K2G37_05425, partial [Clostridia bacterium]|nr:hypothetical protein [Clostridia bacterium]MDE7328854.1 hypothetical protein [Clostridia bacterium]